MDAVLALRLLFELHREFERPLHVAYVDIKAAFDSVDREVLWKALKATGVPPFLLHLIQDLHDGSTSTVRVGNDISCPFLSTFDVRQGCVLAPALFCCATDWVLKRCQADLGVLAGETYFTDLAYADDTALFTREPNEWPTKLQKFEEEAGTMGLYTSWAKTKIQNCTGLGPPSVPASVEGQPVGTTDKFRYLGATSALKVTLLPTSIDDSGSPLQPLAS